MNEQNFDVLIEFTSDVNWQLYLTLPSVKGLGVAGILVGPDAIFKLNFYPKTRKMDYAVEEMVPFQAISAHVHALGLALNALLTLPMESLYDSGKMLN